MQEQDKRYLIFQAYGHEAVLKECAFAMLTFLHHHPKGIGGLQIWIYTDNAAFFKPYESLLPLHYRSIDLADIKEWRGAIDFVHRVKIEVLRDFVKERSGAVLYMDTDICFLRDITRVFEGIEAGRRYMHVLESLLSDVVNPVIRKMLALLKKHEPRDWSIRKKEIPMSSAMWNAGVLGFRCSDAELLDDVLEFTDYLHKLFPKHIVEQFGFSLMFQEAGQVYATSREIMHYWSLKEMREYLASFFSYFADRSVQEQARLSQLIQLHVPMQDRGSFYLNRSPIGKIRRVQWKPLIPDWEAMEKQMPD
jgi:hypothetical protein